MNGGGDHVVALGVGAGDDSVLDGGDQPGDHIALYFSDPGSSLDVDLVAQRVSGTTGGIEASSAFRGFRRIDAVSQSVRITGSDASEYLAGHGCTNAIDGGGGDDRIVWGLPVESTDPETVYSCRSFQATFDGGAGDDTLLGSPGDDTLTGGADADVANGEAGTDTCDAETEIGCE